MKRLGVVVKRVGVRMFAIVGRKKKTLDSNLRVLSDLGIMEDCNCGG